MFILFFSALFLSGGEVRVLAKQYVPYQSHVLPPSADSPLLLEYARVQYAEFLLKDQAFRFELKQSGKTSVLKERPVILACFDVRDMTWHLVHVAIPYPIPESYFRSLRKANTLAERNVCTFPVRAVTPEYTVEHVRGAGASRLLLRVIRHTESGKKRELIVYRMKYAKLSGNPKQSFESQQKTLLAQTYTPLSAHFETEEFVFEGERFLRAHIAYAKQILSKHALAKDTLLRFGLHIPDATVFALHVSEQWDPLFFRLEKEKSYKRILAEYGLNREEAFVWSVSSANAIGPLQFTNMKNNGTYASIVRLYRPVNLSTSFEDGARDLHNVIKAAFCLLDYELAQNTQAKELFRKNPALALLHPVAAYNGGGLAGQRIMQSILRLNKNAVNAHILTLRIPPAIASTRRRRANTETPMYVKKYIAIIRMTT
jgi:hypothetical protein